MKTLNEATTVLEECFLKNRKEWCIENCPYLQNNEQTCRKDVLVDVLHYLKEYRDHMKNEIIELQEEVKKQKEMIEFLEKPLTWDELRTMEGKPVWVEQCNGDTKGWLLILRTNYDVINCTTKHGNSFYLYKSWYGEKWQAYRKER